MITLVVSPPNLQGDEIRIEGVAYRHLFRARRLAVGASMRLVDGQGGARFGRAVRIEASSALIELGEIAPTNEPTRHLELLAPIPKSSRLSWMVEKATEIGVSAIRLIHSERAPRNLGVSSLERLHRVAVAAVEQSHRSRVPVITGIHPASEIPELLDSIPDRWFLQPGAAGFDAPRSDQRAALLVGPEGGWASVEIEQMTRWGCKALGLGPTVLRIETAAVIGCAGILIDGVFR